MSVSSSHSMMNIQVKAQTLKLTLSTNGCFDWPHRSNGMWRSGPIWAGQVPKSEQGSQLCSGSFLRSAAAGVTRSII